MAIGASIAATPARGACATRSPRPRPATPTTPNAIRVTPSSPNAPPNRCATKFRSSWVSTSPRPKRRRADDKGAHDKNDKAKDKKAKSPLVAPTATIGEVEFELLPKGADLWVKNPAKESQLIDEMRRGKELKIRASSKKGAVTVDTYSLTGFKQAIERAVKDCPAA